MAHLASQSVPEFSGEASLPDGTPSMGIREFIQRVDDIMASTGSDSVAMAGAVKQKLVGAAYTWYQTLVQRNSDDTGRWLPRAADAAANRPRVAGLKERLQQEYLRARTPAQYQTHLDTLKQKSGEAANSFFRRVELVSLLLLDDIPEDERTQGRALYDRILERDLRTRFMNGVHPELKQHLMSSEAETSDQLREAAIKFETARKNRGQTSGSINAIQPTGGAVPESQILSGKIAALEQKLGKLLSASSSPSQLQSSAQGGQRRQTSPPDVATLPAGFCHYCSFEGHSKAECRKLQADRSAGKTQQFHEGFLNGGKARRFRQKKAGQVAAVDGSNQPAQPAMVAQQQQQHFSAPPPPPPQQNFGQAAAQWYHEGNLAALQPAGSTFFHSMPPLN